MSTPLPGIMSLPLQSWSEFVSKTDAESACRVAKGVVVAGVIDATWSVGGANVIVSITRKLVSDKQELGANI